jgi:hypothetical protein
MTTQAPDPTVHLVQIDQKEDYVQVFRSTTGEVSIVVGEGNKRATLTPEEARDLGSHLINASAHAGLDRDGYAPRTWDNALHPTASQLRLWLLRCAPTAQDAVLARLLAHGHEGELCWQADHTEHIRQQDRRIRGLMYAFGDLSQELVKSGNLVGYKIRQILEGSTNGQHARTEDRDDRSTGTGPEGSAGLVAGSEG